MENVACRNVATFALFRESGGGSRSRGDVRREDALARPPATRTSAPPARRRPCFDASAVASLPAAVASDLAPLPPGDTWVNAHVLVRARRRNGRRHGGAHEGDRRPPHGLPAMGRYVVTDTLTLPAGQRAGRPFTERHAARDPRRTPAFQASAGEALLEAPGAEPHVVIGVGLYTNGVNAARGREVDGRRRGR